MKIIPTFTWNKSYHLLIVKKKRLSQQPWLQGVLLLTCVILAMVLANLPFTAHYYHNILSTNVQIHLWGDGGNDIYFPFGMTIEKFINDVLMVVFFFTVGLEIRRELSYGELSSTKKALMPVIAAFGGVIMPALIFTAINAGSAAKSGWGIPTATDIAFAVCILTVLGDRVPVSMKVFLTALAIVDDLIAILVVAFFYGGTIQLFCLICSFLFIGLAVFLNKIGEKSMFPYVVCAVAVWILFYYSGIHATMSGVVMAFLIPDTAKYSKSQYVHKRDRFLNELKLLDNTDSSESFPSDSQKYCLRHLDDVTKGVMSMSYRVEHALSPWVTFFIMPIFALANSGVTVSDPSLLNIFRYTAWEGSVTLGIFFGLLLGKPLGITLFSWLAIKLKIGLMPQHTDWKMFFAVACLGGIGFTMSIFVDTLSFTDQTEMLALQLRDAGKIAILFGSIGSALLGTLLIKIFTKNELAG